MSVVSIVICSRDRANTLRQTLIALEQVQVPDGKRCELIVVDSASRDHTAQVVRDFQPTNMVVRLEHEARHGKAYALNAGLSSAQGEVLLFTDDDVRPPRNWIQEMCAPIEGGEADAVAGGIKMAPHLRRPWMGPSHLAALADTTALPEGASLDMIGANAAFSRDVLAKVPRFDTELGPGALGFWEDTLFGRQIEKAGCRLVSRLDVVVEHHFEPSRLSGVAFADRAEKEGRSVAYVSYHWGHADLPGSAAGLAKMKLTLWRHHKDRAREWPHQEGASCAEMQMRHNIGFLKQALAQAGEPRHYEKHGLVKLVNAARYAA